MAIDVVPFPPMFRIARSFPRPAIVEPERELWQQLDAYRLQIQPGSSIAIAVGSRGISGLAGLVRVIVSWVKAQGGEPFIVPAMGSHGGATAEGQASILRDYGVRAESVDAPIRSAMDVVELPGGCEIKVFQDRYAHQADGIILINRVKPHTDFHGPYESGLMKMLAIGLGKQAQALEIHRHGVRGLRDIAPEVARHVLRHSNVVLGVALVENAFEETAELQVMPGRAIPEAELSLLKRARELSPGLPVDDLDILIVDEMGKDISGVGMDTNVIGRLKIPGEPDPERPRIRMIIARSLTLASHGNAVGAGLADIVTQRLFQAIDFQATYENLYTSAFLERGKVPVIADSDAQAFSFAARACTGVGNLRVARIQNTMRLDVLHVSSPVLDELCGRPDIEVRGPVPKPMGDDGELAPF